ncbi:hypothetical protein PEC301899_08530 [Pectobacterium carotovorum subsp. carotovorum]|nr:hypothetical protein PEC301899_08530 [Pectobacterium carotovorum subsp. carotovorum]
MSDSFFCKGIVLCFNCVPESVDVNIKYFWEELAVALREKNFFLIVASTAELNSNIFKTIQIPFNLIDFHQRYGASVVGDVDVEINEKIIDLFKLYYNCDDDVAKKSIYLADLFYSELLFAISPSAVIGWQSTNIINFFVRKHSIARGIPYWSGERGLLKNTLMFDLGDNHSSSESMRSFTIQKIFENYSYNENRFNEIKEKYISNNPSGKYSSASLLSDEDFRYKYNIPLDAKVIVLFLHAEPEITASFEGSQFLKIHGIPPQTLAERIRLIERFCHENGIYLIVQDHPLNKYQPKKIEILESQYIFLVEENIHTLLRAGNCYIHTLSTVQYESVLYGKTIGLLAKSMLYMKQGAYHYEDYSEVSGFMTDLLSENEWDTRLPNLKKRICFLHDYFLIKIDDDNRHQEAERVSEKISFYENPIDDSVINNIAVFLQKWE